MADEGFFSRWSRRKAASTPNKEAPPPAVSDDKPAPQVAPAVPDVARAQRSHVPAQPAPLSAEPLAGEAKPALTMDDVAKLTKDSDYSAFVARGVDEQVKRSALKKLFSDPHFNVMDGLDIYIDDYNKFEPIPAAMLASLTHAKSLLDPLGHLEKPVMSLLNKGENEGEKPEQALTDEDQATSEPAALTAAEAPADEDNATEEAPPVQLDDPASDTRSDPETNPEARS